MDVTLGQPVQSAFANDILCLAIRDNVATYQGASSGANIGLLTGGLTVLRSTPIADLLAAMPTAPDLAPKPVPDWTVMHFSNPTTRDYTFGGAPANFQLSTDQPDPIVIDGYFIYSNDDTQWYHYFPIVPPITLQNSSDGFVVEVNVQLPANLIIGG